MSLFKTTSAVDRAFIMAARENPEVRKALFALRVDAAWESLPKGWTDESAKKFWDSLTGEAKHKVTKCIEKMKGNMDDPGAFCASLADLVDPGWRSRRASSEEIFPKALASILEKWFRQAFKGSRFKIQDVTVSYKDSSLSYKNGVPWDFFVTVKGIGAGMTFVTGADLEGILASFTGQRRPADAKYFVIREVTAEAEKAGFKVGYPARSPNPVLIHGHDLGFVLHLAEFTANEPARVAALDSPISGWLGKKERLVPHIIKALKQEWSKKSYNEGQPSVRDVQQLINGFIHTLFAHAIPGGHAIAQKLWRLFEGSGISQDSLAGREVSYEFRNYFTGPNSLRLLQAAAVSLELLRRGRMPNLAVKCEAVFMTDLKEEMENTPAPEPAGKVPSANDVLKKMVAERLPVARKWTGQSKKVGLEVDIPTVRLLVVEFLEDSNWHSLSNALDRMTPRSDTLSVPSSLVGEISRSEDYSVNYLAVLGIAMLSLVRDKEGISVLKQAVMSKFPDTFVEMEG